MFKKRNKSTNKLVAVCNSADSFYFFVLLFSPGFIDHWHNKYDGTSGASSVYAYYLLLRLLLSAEMGARPHDCFSARILKSTSLCKRARKRESQSIREQRIRRKEGRKRKGFSWALDPGSEIALIGPLLEAWGSQFAFKSKRSSTVGKPRVTE